MLTGYPSVEAAVQAVKAGAEEFLAKPFTSDELLAAVDRAFAKLHSRRALERPPAPPQVLPGLLGESDLMLGAFAAIERAARATSPVLLVGEGGVGKEYMARVIHYGGARGAAAPFVTAALANIPAERMYAELFGVSASSGVAARPGLLHAAAGGSLFLDEVSEATPDVQKQLAAYIEERQAAVRQLRRTFACLRPRLAIWLSCFRTARSERISTTVPAAVTVEVPPLRQRGDDVLLLARHFVRRIAREEGVRRPSCPTGRSRPCARTPGRATCARSRARCVAWW